jgi:tetratricopeptide (TPR) repeat protein
MVGVMKELYGKGPERAKAYFNDDYVFVVMEGGLTKNEETLLAAGQEELVRTYRLRFQEAVASTAKAAVESRKDYPGTWIAAMNLAHIKQAEGNLDATIKILEQARRDYPETWQVIRYQAEVLRISKRPDAARELVENFARKNWWHYEASVALGRLYAELGDAELATAAWRHASWLDVHDAESLNLMAGIRLRQNRLDEAFRIQRRAVARQPDQPRQYRMLSDILAKMGRTDEARAALAQVSQMEAFAQTQASIN